MLAAVNGPAAGIGCSLALACDLVVAAESAFFLLAFVNIGLVPDGGVTATLPARAGFARASEMALLGERVPASTALEWGLINRVVPDDELDEAAGLAARPARRRTDQGLRERRSDCSTAPRYAGLAEQLDAEAAAQREQGRTADFVEGVLAFTEKRPPRFTGNLSGRSPIRVKTLIAPACGGPDDAGAVTRTARDRSSDRVVGAEEALRVV